MSKLHELLAVQGNLAGQATKLRTELETTFVKKRQLFEETRKVFTPLGENVQPKVEEEKAIQTTVGQEIDWISKYLAKAVDVAYQIDLANREAAANVVTDNDEILLKDVPATTLLQLEKRITEWKSLIDAIPTLDPVKGFTLDVSRGMGIYKAREVTKARTRKGKKLYVKYEATKEHPAQTELIDEDIQTGTVSEQEWSALITPGVKAKLLERVEALIRAVARARSKANEQAVDISDKKIGATLLEYVFKPLKEA
jgi:hypothetical protein